MPDSKGADGDQINAEGSQGFINRPSGPITAHFSSACSISISPPGIQQRALKYVYNKQLVNLLPTELPLAQALAIYLLRRLRFFVLVALISFVLLLTSVLLAGLFNHLS